MKEEKTEQKTAGRYLTYEQIDEIRGLLDGERDLDNLSSITKKIHAYLNENKTADGHIKHILSALNSIRILSRDEEMMENRFVLYSSFSYPILFIALMVELEIFDEKTLQEEADIASRFFSGDISSHEA